MHRLLVGSMCLAVVLVALMTPASATAAGTWSAAASMTQARGGHTATLLPNGTVLVAGGYNGASLSTAELYDAASNTWTATGSMATARYNHTATLLPNGKVLVTGGQNDGPSPIGSAEIYDPSTHVWAYAASMSIPRFSHSATLLTNGKVLVAGGYNIASAELYDPAANTWSPAASMATPRRLFTATLLGDGSVLVAGGVNCLPCVPLNGAEVYSPTLDSWSSVSGLATARYQHSASLLPNGEVLVAGGWNGDTSYTSVEIYRATTHDWVTGPAMATNRVSHTATSLVNHTILVVGGGGGFGHAFDEIATAEIFDPDSMLWSPAGTMSQGRTNHTATLLNDGRVLVPGGGTIANGYTNTAEIFAPPPQPSVGGIAEQPDATVLASHTAAGSPDQSTEYAMAGAAVAAFLALSVGGWAVARRRKRR